MNDIYDAIGDFDPESVPEQVFEVIPAGWHKAIVEKCEVSDTKKRDGKVLKTQFGLIEEYEGRVLFSRINLANPNPKCVEIGQREMAAFARACEIARPKDSTEFIDKVIEIKVSVTTFNGEAQNEIKGYRALGAGASVPAPRASRAQPTGDQSKPEKSAPAASPSPARKRPWER